MRSVALLQLHGRDVPGQSHLQIKRPLPGTAGAASICYALPTRHVNATNASIQRMTDDVL
jgi:hypothetical protein